MAADAPTPTPPGLPPAGTPPATPGRPNMRLVHLADVTGNNRSASVLHVLRDLMGYLEAKEAAGEPLPTMFYGLLGTQEPGGYVVDYFRAGLSIETEVYLLARAQLQALARE